MPDVLVAGGGPTGLMAAFELERAGLDVLVLERDARPTTQSKALALQPRSVEVLADRGLLAAIEPHVQARLPAGHFSGIPIDYTDLPTRFPYQLGVEQAHVAAAIEARLRTPVLRGAAVTAVEQDGEGVTVTAGGRAPPGGVARRGRRRAQHGPDAAGRRVPRHLGADLAGRRRPHARQEARRARRRLAAAVARVGVPAAALRRALPRGRRRRGAAAARPRRARHGRRAAAGADRRARAGDRGGRGALGLTVRRRGTAAGAVPPRPRAVRGRRRAHPPPGRRPGAQPGPAGRGEPRLEAGRAGPRARPRRAARQLPRRAPPGRRPGAGQHPGAGGARRARSRRRRPSGRSSPGCSPSPTPAAPSRWSCRASGSPTRARPVAPPTSRPRPTAAACSSARHLPAGWADRVETRDGAGAAARPPRRLRGVGGRAGPGRGAAPVVRPPGADRAGSHAGHRLTPVRGCRNSSVAIMWQFMSCTTATGES